jgi:uncharacterized RDD family membrane protein YckC
MSTETQPTQENEIAPEWKRLVNFVIDLAIVYGILILLFRDVSEGGGQLVLIIGLFLYYFLFETFLQKTPAKFITRTKVVSLDGSNLTAGTIALRTLVRFVPFEVISAIGTPKGERTWWHDRWVKTRVVNA